MADIQKDVRRGTGESKPLKAVSPAKSADKKFGARNVTDIIKELEKSGRDPRPEFATATFK